MRKEINPPTSADLEVIAKELAASPVPQIEHLDIQHDRDGLTQYLHDLEPHLPKRFNTKEEDRKMKEDGNSEGLFYSVAMMVVSEAYKRTNENNSIMDLIQEGNMSVLKSAIPTYNPDISKFSTWAMWWIWQGQSLAIKKNFRDYHLSMSDVDNVRKVQKIYWDLEEEKGEKPSLEKISELTGFKPVEVANLINIAESKTVSLTSEIDETGIEFSEIVEDKNALYQSTLENFVGDKIELDKTLAEIEKILESSEMGKLPPRSRDILRLKLKGYNNVEIGKMRGITRERVGQLVRKILGHFQNEPDLQQILNRYLYPKK